METVLSRRSPDDTLLLKLACAGDQQAFAGLVQNYQGSLYRFEYTCLGSDEADDAVQFVWIQFYRCMPSLLSSQPADMSFISLKHWLFRVAKNRCCDIQRRQARHRRLPLSDLESEFEEEAPSTYFDPAPQPEEWAVQREEAERIRAAISTLPSKARTIVWLHYKEDLTFPEIGQRLQIPVSTAKTYYHRARKKLRAALAQECENAEDANAPATAAIS
jgi:RNA polymerase sigma-70 factor (ECF subfamily)